jgi:vancomycin resistance protein YoaR
MNVKQWIGLLGLPAVLLLACWGLQPFSKMAASKTLSTTILSRAQTTNLVMASRYLDGWVLKSGEQFSFNRIVGPRTVARGYVQAPSYLEADSPPTTGGGICLLSSGLYQLALSAGLAIEQRVPHLRTIHSVPPGLDATVWYGGADLRFVNTLPFPVRIRSRVQDKTLFLVLEGAHIVQPVRVSRIEQRQNPTEVVVTVFQREHMVSRDRYRLSP